MADALTALLWVVAIAIGTSVALGVVVFIVALFKVVNDWKRGK